MQSAGKRSRPAPASDLDTGYIFPLGVQQAKDSGPLLQTFYQAGPSFIASWGAAELRTVCSQANCVPIGHGRAAEVLRVHVQPGPQGPVIYTAPQKTWDGQVHHRVITEEKHYKQLFWGLFTVNYNILGPQAQQEKREQ